MSPHGAAGPVAPALEPSARLALAAQRLNATLALDAVRETALALALELSGARTGFVALGDAGAGVSGTDADDAARQIVARVLATGDPYAGRAAPDAPGSVACLPLRARHEVIGAIYLEGLHEDGLAPAERELLDAFAHQAALAVENARTFEAERERVQRIAALQAFQTRILEAIANGVITLSPKREITTFNRAAEATFGLATEIMVGKHAFTIASVIPEFPELLDTFFASGAVQLRAEVEATRSDGSDLTLEVRFSPLHNADGTGVAIVVTDVTRQRALEQAHEAEVEKAHRVRETFSRYLAPHVVESLMDDPASVQLGGHRYRATMLFADVRGFTSIAAHLSAERVVEILNAYFDEAVKVVFAHDGLLDKFYGDGLMAVFGPPRVRGDDAARAVAAAIALHRRVAAMRPLHDQPLRISVGLATGDVVAGHIGSAQRMDYTVIGDAVNLASGLQHAAPPGSIYCDDETMTAAGRISRPVQRIAVRVKGRSELVAAHTIGI